VWNVTDAAELVPLDEDSYYQDPLGFFGRLRESRPVAPVRMPGYGRAWVVTRYADVRTVLTDPGWRKTSTGGRVAAGPGRARRRVSTRTCSTRTRLTTPGCAAWCRRCSRGAATAG
jgi:cytochrome P450